MALLKSIELSTGVTVNYHRITTVTKVTNCLTYIEVSSYISKDKRDEEVDLLTEGKPVNTLIETSFYQMKYDEDATIKDLYEYLKSLEVYAGATDI